MIPFALKFAARTLETKMTRPHVYQRSARVEMTYVSSSEGLHKGCAWMLMCFHFMAILAVPLDADLLLIYGMCPPSGIEKVQNNHASIVSTAV